MSEEVSGSLDRDNPNHRIPRSILAAILHVRSVLPDVDRVVYWEDTRWQFSDDNHRTPAFPPEINVSILEAAVYDLYDLPAAYQYYPEFPTE